jgi:hypothetical protein
MAYNANIPQPTDQLSDSQADLLANFQAIQTLIDVNHYDFNNANQGKHFIVSMPPQASAPPVAFAAGEVGLYSFINATTGQSELYINKTNEATVTQIPATASTLSLTSAPAQGTEGWSYLPSGLYITWGAMTVNGNTLVTLPTPPPNQILSIQLTPASGSSSYVNAQVVLNNIASNSTFNVVGTINGSAAAVLCYYFVIGY